MLEKSCFNLKNDYLVLIIEVDHPDHLMLELLYIEYKVFFFSTNNVIHFYDLPFEII